MKKYLKEPIFKFALGLSATLLILAITLPALNSLSNSNYNQPKIVSVYDGNTLITKYENVIVHPIDDGKSYYFYDEDGTKVIINGDIIKISDM